MDKQAVISSITDVIEPSDLQLQAEEAIDELYRWFEGEVDSPEFSITIQDKVPDLSPALKNELTSQLSNLPICQPSEVAANQDIISAICIPEGESVSGEVDEYIDSLLSGEGFLGDATFSASDIPDLDDATESVQGFYPIFKNIPFIAAGVSAISTLVIVLSAKSGVARGVRDVGVSLFGSSFFLAIGSFFLSRIDSLPDNFIGLDGGAARSEVEASHAIVEPLFITILHDVSSSIFIVAGVVFVVGLLLALAGWQLGRPRSKASHSTMLTEDDQPNHEKWDKPNA